MGSFTPNGLYMPGVGPPAEKGWGALVDANWLLLDPLLGNNAVSQIRTQPPITLTSGGVPLTVGTSVVNLSSIAGGIPVGTTHALLSVAPPKSAGNPNGDATVQPTVGNIYLSEDGVNPPSVAAGFGAFIAGGFQDEVTNLSQQKLVSEVAGVKVTTFWRKYP